MAKRTSRVVWGLAALLSVVLLGSASFALVRLKPYWVAKHRGEEADLRGAVLPHASLASANLWMAKLTHADLRGALLQKAYLAGADLQGARLQGANLQNADLQGAELQRAVLRNADLRGANLWFAILDGTDLRNSDLRGANLGAMDTYSSPVDLRGADLRGANLRGTWLPGLIIDETTRLDARWRLIWELVTRSEKRRRLRRAYLFGLNLAGAHLQQADLRCADLREALLLTADLRGADLRGADLRAAHLTGLSFARAWDRGHKRRILERLDPKRADARLTGAIYDSHTRWPTGFEPQQHGAVRLP